MLSGYVSIEISELWLCVILLRSLQGNVSALLTLYEVSRPFTNVFLHKGLLMRSLYIFVDVYTKSQVADD